MSDLNNILLIFIYLKLKYNYHYKYSNKHIITTINNLSKITKVNTFIS